MSRQPMHDIGLYFLGSENYFNKLIYIFKINIRIKINGFLKFIDYINFHFQLLDGQNLADEGVTLVCGEIISVLLHRPNNKLIK